MTEIAGTLKVMEARLSQQTPGTVLKLHRGTWETVTRRLQSAMPLRLESERKELRALVRAFEAIGPQQTLERGYAIITREQTGQILRDADSGGDGEKITARLKLGSLTATVEKPEP